MNKKTKKQVKRWIGYIAIICGIIAVIFGVLYLVAYFQAINTELVFEDSWSAIFGIVPGYTGLYATSIVILVYAIVDFVVGIVCFIIAIVFIRSSR
jgi:divalent metal cation (Fe/Co/Zn/Cd) transporter